LLDDPAATGPLVLVSRSGGLPTTSMAKAAAGRTSHPVKGLVRPAACLRPAPKRERSARAEAVALDPGLAFGQTSFIFVLRASVVSLSDP
jgi:hypothetical protein